MQKECQGDLGIARQVASLDREWLGSLRSCAVAVLEKSAVSGAMFSAAHDGGCEWSAVCLVVVVNNIRCMFPHRLNDTK